ncbi:MAG: DUF6174 domain-containing protein [Gemmataceae bacterium]
MAERKPRRWIWYFVVLGVLSVVAVAVPISYNMRLRLTPEQLTAARARWEAHGPRNYRLQYTKKGGVNETVVVWVRNGQVRAVLVKDHEDQPDQMGRLLQARLHPHYGVPALFDDIQRFLDLPQRTYMRAQFDPDYGHVTFFSRQVLGTQESITLTNIKLEPQEAGMPLPEFLYRNDS